MSALNFVNKSLMEHVLKHAGIGRNYCRRTEIHAKWVESKFTLKSLKASIVGTLSAHYSVSHKEVT